MRKIVTSIAAVAMMIGGIAVVGAVSANATTVSVPTITVTPNIGLTNNQKVSITGSGFSANESSLVAVECNGSATTEAGCNIAAPAPLTVDANGNIAASTYVVTTGTIGNGTCGTSATDATCIISIGSIATGKLVTYATFSFSSGPGLSVSPSTGVSNGQAVTLTGANFTPGDSLYAVECLATATTEAGCDTSTATPVTASSTGAVSTEFKAVTGTVGNGTCGTSAANYNGCVIEVANLTGGDKADTSIDFVAPAVTPVPTPSATKVTASGVPGKTVAAAITGKNFTAVAKITGAAGSTITVTGVAKTVLHVKIKESASAKKGTGTLVIHFKDGKVARVTYRVS